MLPNARYADESCVSAFIQQECEQKCVEAALDGPVLGSWRLCFLNARGAQQDRLIILTKHSVLRVNVAFDTTSSNGPVRHATRLPIKDIERIEAGPIVYDTESSRRVAAAFDGPRSSVKETTRAVRIVMTRAFVDASGRSGGVASWLTGKDQMDVRACTLTSKLATKGTPEPTQGPRSIHSFEAALRDVLSETDHVVAACDVLVCANAAAIFGQTAIRSSVHKALAATSAMLGRRDPSAVGDNYLEDPQTKL